MDAVNRRYDPKHIEWFYGSSLAGLRGDEAPLVVLDALLRHFADAAVPVLVYVAPVNRPLARATVETSRSESDLT